MPLMDVRDFIMFCIGPLLILIFESSDLLAEFISPKVRL
jgi:hypothetical protein